MRHKSEDPFVHLESIVSEEVIVNSASRFEMNNLKSMKTLIKGGQGESVDEDGIHLKHDLEHTRSAIDYENAGIVSERQ